MNLVRVVGGDAAGTPRQLGTCCASFQRAGRDRPRWWPRACHRPLISRPPLAVAKPCPAAPTPQHPPAPHSMPLRAPQFPRCSVLCDTEVQLQPSCAYMDLHGPCVSPDLFLDATMRRTATSWLVEVAAEFGLHQETLFLATALLDRFLSSAKVRPPVGNGGWAAVGSGGGWCTSAALLVCCVGWELRAAGGYRLWQAPAGLASSLAGRQCASRCPLAQGVPRTQLQLVCVACMLVAAKHEEVRCAVLCCAVL